MKPLFLLLFVTIGYGIMQGQMSVMDSVSGGNYVINGNSVIDSLIHKATIAQCTNAIKGDNAVKETFGRYSCNKHPKVMGYKIQLMYSKDRNAAEKAKASFIEHYPTIFPELVYTQPDYRILVGDYFSKESAKEDLSPIQHNYPAAFLVPWRIWCTKAK